MENKVLDIIIEFIKGYNAKDSRLLSEDGKSGINSCNYLLPQIIRQYCLNVNQIYISTEAINLWNQISGEPIFDYWYRDKVTMTKDGEVEIEEYVGNSNKPKELRKLKKNDTFTFRDVFHDEHIIPIKMIVDELVALKDPNYENVKSILDKLAVCRMLKTQDRKIIHKYNRSTNLCEVFKTDYKDIELQQLKEWKQRF